MKKDKKVTNAKNSKAAPAKAALGLPREMAIVAICRGAQTGWPQLVEAMEKLREDPAFCNSFPNSFASADGVSIGRPQQLLAALTVAPALLAKPSPPADVYAWSVWVTARVYEASRTIGGTLAQLPGLFAAAKGAKPAEIGAQVREVLGSPLGLASTAGNVAVLAKDFADHLDGMGGDLEAARTARQAISSAFETQKLINGSEDIAESIRAHPSASAKVHEINYQLDNFVMAAAKVSAFGVIANMTNATRSLAAAWQAVNEQFESAAASDPEKLGNLAFLNSTLKLESAVTQWSGFAEVTQNYLKRSLRIR